MGHEGVKVPGREPVLRVVPMPADMNPNGDIVSFYAEVMKVGRTSITVDVQVFAERHPANPLVVKVTEAQLTYVAINDDGSKREVPPASGAYFTSIRPPMTIEQDYDPPGIARSISWPRVRCRCRGNR